MTGTDVAVRQPTALTNAQLEMIAKTDFVPKGLRGNLPAILACVAVGRELGLGDMAALRSIHIIEGQATFSAELMVQLVRRAGHSITGEVTDGSATVTGRRADNGDVMSSTWTMAMAERAGLAGKGNWKKYPEAMLWARAVSQLCRMLFADCFAGATYTTEELGAEDTDMHGVPASERDPLFTPIDGADVDVPPRAAGSGSSSPDPGQPPAPPTVDRITELRDQLLDLYPDDGTRDAVRGYIADNADKHVMEPDLHEVWLLQQIAKKANEPEQQEFQIPAGALEQ